MELLSFGQFWGKYIDAVVNDDIAGRAGLVQAITMAQEAGLVDINGSDVRATYADRTKYFRVEPFGMGYRVVVPEGMFPELENYAGGDLLRYANEGE